MSAENRQSQRSGPGSVNTQILLAGPNWQEIRQLVTDSVQAELYRYTQESKELIDRRTVEIVEKVIARVSQSGPEVARAFKDPDVQHVVGELSKAYVRTGDDNLADVLVDLLADRCSNETRSLMALVLNDAIETAPKLTDQELAALSLAWRVHRTVSLLVVDLETFGAFIEHDLLPFANDMPSGEASYFHLQYLGCLAVMRMAEPTFEQAIRTLYGGLFSRGFDETQIPPDLQRYADDRRVFTACVHDPDRLQVNAMSLEALNARMPGYGIPDEHVSIIRNIYNAYLMPEDVIKEKLIAINPRMADFIERWNSCEIRRVDLTPVGIAISHANYRRVAGMDAPLSIWVS